MIEFHEENGTQWYLREFDFLPEPVKFYRARLSKKFFALSGINFKLYATKEDAMKDSIRIRRMLGLKEITE
jgi:hypothetical protein